MVKHVPHFSDFRSQIPLIEHPAETMRMACTKCDRNGKVSRARMVEAWGPQMGLVDLLQVIAKDCPQQTPDWQGIRRCGVYYVDLKERG